VANNSHSTDNQPEQRDSRLSFKAFFKDQLMWGLMPLAAGAIALTIGKLTNYKIWPLDGSPSLGQHLWEMLLKGSSKKVTGREMKITEADRTGIYTQFLAPEYRENAPKNFWNFWKATEIGVVALVFHVWQRGEKKRFDLTDNVDSMHIAQMSKLSPLELEQANAALHKQQLFFSEHAKPAPTINTASTQHDGVVAHNSRAEEQGGFDR
jgi:hypothetical protein